METSPPSALTSATARKEVGVEQSCEVPDGASLQHEVVLPQARSSLVWGLLESCRDTHPNPTSLSGEESQGGAGQRCLARGGAYVDCLSLLRMAGKTLTTLTVRARRGQLKVKRLEADLA